MTHLRTTALLLVTTLPAAAAMSAQEATDSNPHARWEKAIQRFEEADIDDPRPREGVLFVGSSSIRFWNLKKWFPDQPAINHGFGGSQIDDTIHFADRIVWPFAPKIIVFYAGDNDIAAGKSAETVTADFQTFSRLVREQLPQTELVYIAIKPSLARWKLSDEMKKANDAIAQLCAAEERRRFLDVWTPMLGEDGRPNPHLFIKDGLHLNQAGYELWSGMIAEQLDDQSAAVNESDSPAAE